ncbi:hypothetical protein J437_LFUL014586 [Ladona fulva]|uniref:CDT1 Geminin-binding domain-containing protein n=1 Tax=Ladona fulva TaxID=123851 RepID=A0A8K0K1P5_LADFU|nr:hypothetical protein J437_LFUL014586 [Ladona fulva]
MSTQSTLTTFYSARKRSSIDEIKKHAKVRIIDDCNSDQRIFERTEEQGTVLLLQKTREIVASNVSEGVSINIQKSGGSKPFVATLKSTKKSRIKLDVPKGKGKTTKSICKSRQKSLKDVFANLDARNKEISNLEERPVEIQNPTKEPVSEADPSKDDAVQGEQKNDNIEKQSKSPRKRTVTFEKKGTLSPVKVNDSKRSLFEAAIGRENANSAKGSNSESHEKNNQASAASGSLTKMSRKELSLGEIRGRIIKSPRLTELRESIARISSCAAKIREADREKDSGAALSLQKFQSIEFEIPVVCSPKKNMLASPCKSPPASPIPAYQRYAHLTSPIRMPVSPSKAPFVSPSKSSPLVLPYQYRCLAEVFRCVDVVSAMMMNRKELITFSKLRSAVQEMMRRTMTDRHLGQIKKVFPDAFEFYYTKVNQLTVSSVRSERYELVIKPVLKSKDEEVSDKSRDDTTKSDGKVNCMTPSVLLERRHTFHRNLLEIVKDHHEEFLHSLEPPIAVPREKLTRWHPSFEVDILPEVEPSDMPQPPDAPEKCSSAKDVLSKARNLFGCNTRMEKALQKVSMGDSKGTQEKVDEGSNPSTSTASDESAPPTNPALKGIPLALLKKVRERQAAKAMMAMTMSPADEMKAVRLSRLPELARILRGIFVSERKGVLSLEHVIKKLGDSYRGNLKPSELEDHVRLLETSVPGWTSIFSIRHCHYVKLAKDAELSRVISKLEKLANEAKG